MFEFIALPWYQICINKLKMSIGAQYTQSDAVMDNQISYGIMRHKLYGITLNSFTND